jgi:hypothetical protein
MIGQQLTPLAPQYCIICDRRSSTLRRGLCRHCYPNHGPRRGEHWTRELGSNYIKRPLPQPTNALPGTKAKMTVLAERLRLGQELWHPLDATWDNLPSDYLNSLLGL